MEALLFHPKVVHIPIALAVLMPLITAGVLWAWWRQRLQAGVWLLVVALQALLLVSSVIAMQTGEAEEERVERIVPEAAVEAHEEAAEAFVWVSAAALAVMLGALVGSRGRFGLPLGALALAGTVVVFALGARVGHLGGALVYEHGAANAYLRGAPPGLARPGRHLDDD